MLISELKVGDVIRTGMKLDIKGQFIHDAQPDFYWEEAKVEGIGQYHDERRRKMGVYARVINGRNTGWAGWYNPAHVKTTLPGVASWTSKNMIA